MTTKTSPSKISISSMSLPATTSSVFNSTNDEQSVSPGTSLMNPKGDVAANSAPEISLDIHKQKSMLKLSRNAQESTYKYTPLPMKDVTSNDAAKESKKLSFDVDPIVTYNHFTEKQPWKKPIIERTDKNDKMAFFESFLPPKEAPVRVFCFICVTFQKLY